MVGLIRRNLLTARRLSLFLMIVLLMVVMSLCSVAGGSTASENVGGRRVSIRPGDLVGAITGEAGVESRSIGAIEINDGFSPVEVPDALADQIIDALRATKVRELRLASEYRGPWPLTVSPERHSSRDL